MAKKEEIEITIGKNGEVNLHVTGIAGPDCMKLTEELEEALGIIQEKTKTNEFYQTPVEEEQHIQNESPGAGK
ncbi:MAG: DUF2997 domain-containing protein [Spirochaetales bacterium]|nr:DUF2997 domain-containing protein [Spirochaetales bacterium]